MIWKKQDDEESMKVGLSQENTLSGSKLIIGLNHIGNRLKRSRPICWWG